MVSKLTSRGRTESSGNAVWQAEVRQPRHFRGAIGGSSLAAAAATFGVVGSGFENNLQFPIMEVNDIHRGLRVSVWHCATF